MKSKRALLPSLLFVLFVAGVPAAAVTLEVGTVAGQAGALVVLPVTISGLAEDIHAYEFTLSWSSAYAQCVGIVTAGTVSENWSVSQSSGLGTAFVAGAGAVPLAGDGVLVELQMQLSNYGFSASVSVSFSSALLNEGGITPTLIGGSLQFAALPVVSISPGSAMIVVGDSLQFTAAGGTAPYTYTAAGPAVADFAGGSWLHALSPGTTRVSVADVNGVTATTGGVIEVRACRLRIVPTSVTVGDTAMVPVEVVDPTGFGITAGEIRLSWPSSQAVLLGVDLAGTIAEGAGWGEPFVAPEAGQATVAMAGVSPLVGSGVLCYLRILPSSSVSISVAEALFNEMLPALASGGYVTVTTLPAIYVSPGSANLKAGDQLQFTASGALTPPLQWSTDSPLVATIGSTGLLTALGEGRVRVTVMNGAGASSQTGFINICGLGLPGLVSSIGASQTVLVPLKVSRPLNGLGIYSYELAVSYAPASVAFDGVVTTGALAESWDAPTVLNENGVVRVYHAGPQALAGCGPALLFLQFTGKPGLGSPYTGVTLSSALFNEGAPCAILNSGAPCSYVAAVPEPDSPLELWPCEPNPFNPQTTIRFRLAADGDVDLDVFNARGQLIRQLVRGWQTGGSMHAVTWNGRDEQGRILASGVYYYRLRSGGREQMGRMMLLR